MQAGKSITFREFEALCDDPARDDIAGMGDVRALLHYDQATGFELSALDGETEHEVVDEHGRRVSFRTIEQALSILQRVSGLSGDISIRLSPRK
jgi:hypothetical protein